MRFIQPGAALAMALIFSGATAARAEEPDAAPSAPTETPAPASALDHVALSASLVLKVVDRDKSADTLVAETERLGGYFAVRTNDRLVLKVPKSAMLALLRAAEAQGIAVARSRNAEDLAVDLQKRRALLASRREVLKRYFEVLATASASSVVAVEQQMTGLIQEIEGLLGSIRMIEHRLGFAQVSVEFRFRERQPPARDGSSSFSWLNTVNLLDLVQDLTHVDD